MRARTVISCQPVSVAASRAPSDTRSMTTNPLIRALLTVFLVIAIEERDGRAADRDNAEARGAEWTPRIALTDVVHVDGPGHLYRRIANHGIELACLSPCDRPLLAGVDHCVDGPKMFASGWFQLAADRGDQTIQTKHGSAMGVIGGLSATAASSALGMLGLLIWPRAWSNINYRGGWTACSNGTATCGGSQAAVYGSGALMGVAAAGIVTGIAIAISSASTSVRISASPKP